MFVQASQRFDPLDAQRNPPVGAAGAQPQRSSSVPDHYKRLRSQWYWLRHGDLGRKRRVDPRQRQHRCISRCRSQRSADWHVHVHDRATIFPSRSDYAFLERQNKKNGQKDSLIYPKQGDYAYRFGLPNSEHHDPATWRWPARSGKASRMNRANWL